MTRQDAIEYDNWLKSGLMQEAEVLGLGEKAGSDLADRYITVIPDDERKGMVFLGEEAASYKLGNVRLDLKKAIVAALELAASVSLPESFLEKKVSSLYDTVAQAMSGIVYAAEKKEISVSVNCPEELMLSHDSKWTVEALFNLLDNAVKYTSVGGKISVSVVQWEMYVEIKVADNGKGISESNQAAIFRRFYREEEVHSEPGVGIGLYLAREIITRQGGYIKVVSALGNLQLLLEKAVGLSG